jgi:MFS family permease
VGLVKSKSGSGPDNSPASVTYSANYKTSVLGLLVLAYTCNFIDRTIIYTIGQAIKVDLLLTDTELGLLGGLAFAIFYTVLGIPIARLADRSHRVNIIAAAIALWSAFTAACGLAANFVQLLFLRMGVGVGEAGLSPPAHSLISDYYEPRRRGVALSIYGLGIPFGTMLGAVMGGWIVDHFSWRMAFLVVGLPGLLIALAIKVFVREPPRGHSERSPASAPQATGATAPPLGKVIRTLFRSWGVIHLIAGCTLVSLAAYGTATYAQAYYIRQFGVSYTQVGLVFGLVVGLSTAIGTLLGGWLADRKGGNNARWYALVPAIGVSLSLPLHFLAFTTDSWQQATWLLFLPGIFYFTYAAPSWALVQNVVPGPMRATAAALLLFIVNILGMGVGPPISGWFIDTYSASIFSSYEVGTLVQMCPGGIGYEGSSAEIDMLCRSSVAQGTQWGILTTLGFFLWGALHYFASAMTLPRGPVDRLAEVDASVDQ